MSDSGIYTIINTITGRQYIGSTKHLEKRRYEHFLSLKHNIHGNRYLQNSFNKYGMQKFDFRILERLDIDGLIPQEQYWIDRAATLKIPLYNTCLLAGSPSHETLTIEHRRKIGESKLGKPRSEECRRKLSLAHTGKKASKETIQKMIASRSGQKRTQEFKDSISGQNNPNSKTNRLIRTNCGQEL